jgi:restriction endonuclease S subunit
VSQFKLSSQVDKNKIFLASRADLAGRFDPEMVLYNKTIKNFAFPTYPLHHFLKAKPQYGAGERGMPRQDINIPRYIRITDIDEKGQLINDSGATAAVIEDQYLLNNNDLLIARSGNTVGKAYLHKADKVNYLCFYAGYMIRFIIDETQLLPEFVSLYTQLKPYRDWVKAVQRTAGQPNINAEEYKSFPIPKPDIETQQKLVKHYETDFDLMSQKEQQAQAILAGIDAYLLAELDITLPQQDIKQNASFLVRLSEIESRLDPHQFHFERVNTIKVIGLNNQVVRLHELVKNVKKITTEIDENDVYIGLENILSNTGEYIATSDKQNISSASIFKKGHILFPKLRPYLNKVYLAEFDGICSTEFHVFEAVNFNAEFLAILLRSTLIVNQTKHLMTGNTLPRLQTEDINNLLIPLVPLQKQNEIAKHVSHIRSQAKQLQTEAIQILANAKAEVERMILGE